jgi:hypothetical protein
MSSSSFLVAAKGSNRPRPAVSLCTCVVASRHRERQIGFAFPPNIALIDLSLGLLISYYYTLGRMWMNFRETKPGAPTSRSLAGAMDAPPAQERSVGPTHYIFYFFSFSFLFF